MKFGIITPTHNRYKLLKRCINSVLNQTYQNFELIIIDDSTDNMTFENIKKDFSDSRIKYIKNNKNSGVNFSRNVGLNTLSDDTDFVVFLDDDDYFDVKCLQKAKEIIEKKSNIYWFISNKKGITQVQKYNKEYNYFYDYFIGKKIKGDATHFIKKDIIGEIRFSKIIKQGQEWLFFIELGEENNFSAYNFDSTFSEYLPGGLTDQKGIKVIISQCISILEFLFFRHNTFKFKISFFSLIIPYIIKNK